MCIMVAPKLIIWIISNTKVILKKVYKTGVSIQKGFIKLYLLVHKAFTLYSFRKLYSNDVVKALRNLVWTIEA